MTRRRVLIIGSGKRVREAALPVFERASELFELAGVFSRTPKRIESEGREVLVRGLDTLSPAELATIDLVYMVVSKPAVPGVLRRLVSLGIRDCDLLIETPVMLFRHLGHLGLLRAFRNTWVSEDTSTLPCFDPLHDLVASGELGALKSARFDRSAYAYHGVAMAKAALSCTRVASARQKSLSGDTRQRDLTLVRADGARRHATLLDPRDYSKGRMSFELERGRVAENSDEAGAPTLRLEPEFAGEGLTGFRLGDHRRTLDDAERSLMGTRGEGAGLTAWMDGMKRVGFLALIRQIAAGRGAYSLDQALEDAVVDYHLEKLGRYWSTPLTDPRRALSRWSYRLVTMVARG